MATLRQIQANRRNSQKSTGPRTPAGKAVSSMNALKSGIDAESQVIRGEEAQSLDALKDSYYDSLRPTRPEEAVFVDAIIAADWLLRRLRKAEAETWNDAFEKQENYEEYAEKPKQNYRLATALQDRGDTFARLQRRLDAAERSLHRAMEALLRLRESKPDPDDPPAVDPPPPVLVTPSSHDNKPQIGFVPPDLFSALTSAPQRLRVESVPSVSSRSRYKFSS
jgi:hypothetical protein